MKIGLVGKICSGKTYTSRILSRRCALKKFDSLKKLNSKFQLKFKFLKKFR